MGKKLKVVAIILALITIVLMGFVVYFLSLPGELPEKIDGREDIIAGRIKEDNLLDDLKLAVDSKTPIILTEERINHYLASKVVMTQGGKLSEYISIKGVWVKLEKDAATVFIEREVTWGGGKDEEGNEIPVSKQDHITKFGVELITKETEKGGLSIVIKPLGGKIGGMPTPGTFALLAKVSVDKLLEAFSEEKKLFKKMLKITVKEGSIEMSSRGNVIIKKRKKP